MSKGTIKITIFTYYKILTSLFFRKLRMLSVFNLKKSYQVPSALSSTVAAKWWIPAQEDVHDDTQAPQITSLVVDQIPFRVVHEGLNNLRGHELG